MTHWSDYSDGRNQRHFMWSCLVAGLTYFDVCMTNAQPFAKVPICLIGRNARGTNSSRLAGEANMYAEQPLVFPTFPFVPMMRASTGLSKATFRPPPGLEDLGFPLGLDPKMNNDPELWLRLGCGQDPFSSEEAVMHDDNQSSISTEASCGLSTEASRGLPIDINEPNKHGWTSLHRAVIAGRADVVGYLLADPDFVAVNAKLPSGETALHLAAQTGQMQAVKILLAHPKTDVNTCSRGRRAFQLAGATGNKDVEAVIIADPRSQGVGSFWGAPPVLANQKKARKKAAKSKLQDPSRAGYSIQPPRPVGFQTVSVEEIRKAEVRKFLAASDCDSPPVIPKVL